MKGFKSYSLNKQIDRQTDRQTDMTENIINPQTQVVMNAKLTTLAILESSFTRCRQ